MYVAGLAKQVVEAVRGSAGVVAQDRLATDGDARAPADGVGHVPGLGPVGPGQGNFHLGGHAAELQLTLAVALQADHAVGGSWWSAAKVVASGGQSGVGGSEAGEHR